LLDPEAAGACFREAARPLRLDELRNNFRMGSANTVFEFLDLRLNG
jgi:hypothetical protein